MKIVLIVKADTNDGDYVTKVKSITNAEIAQVKVILAKMKEVDSSNYFAWGTSELLDEDNDPSKIYKLSKKEIDFMETFLPRDEYGIHTIESMTLTFIESEEDLLK